LTEVELVNHIEEHMNFLVESACNTRFLTGLAQQYQFVYACLLKMVMLKLCNRQLSIDKCIGEFTQFCHDVLATIAGRELVLARWLLSTKKLQKFFHKLERKQIDTLRNMAWDLLHVRQMEKRFSLTLDSRASFFFSSLLTFDKGLSEVIDLYPLRAMACRISHPVAIPFFADDWRRQIASTQAEIDAYKTRFFSIEARADRETRREAAKHGLYLHIHQMEQQLVDQHGFASGKLHSIATYPHGWA